MRTQHMHCVLLDLHTRTNLSKVLNYDHAQRLRNKAEKLNLEHGSHRYTVQLIFLDDLKELQEAINNSSLGRLS